MKKKGQNKKITILLIIVLISIGFAYLTTTVNINGLARLLPATWDIHFENIVVDDKSVPLSQGDVAPNISADGLTISFEVTLPEPGKRYAFQVDVVNDGDIDANVELAQMNELTPTQEKYINFWITDEYEDYIYFNDSFFLGAGTRKTYKLIIEYKNNLSNEDELGAMMSVPISVRTKYVQADEDSIRYSMFQEGHNVSEKMATLSNSDVQTMPPKALVKEFKRANALPDNITMTNDNIISTTESDVPIYMWFVVDTEDIHNAGTIYWYSEADIVYLNYDSSCFFSLYLSNGYYYSNFGGFDYLEDISGLSTVQTRKVRQFANFFYKCISLDDFSPLSGWSTEKAINMYNMFNGCTSLDDSSFLTNWNVREVADMEYMFYGCTSLDSIDGIYNWSTASLIYASYMFKGCTSLSDLSGVQHLDTRNIETALGMFEECTSIEDLDDFVNWNLSSMSVMGNMFSGCTSLDDISGLQNLKFDNVKYLYNMFYGCTSLQDISPVANWNTKNVLGIEYMFSGCTSLSDISPLSNWNIKKVMTLSGLFKNCTSLVNITSLRNWQPASVQTIDYMFQNCTSLADATCLNSWSGDNFISMTDAFDNTAATTAQKLPTWYS